MTFGQALAEVKAQAKQMVVKPCKHTAGATVGECPTCMEQVMVWAFVRGKRYEERAGEPAFVAGGTQIVAEHPEKDSTDAEVSTEEAKRLRDAGLIVWDRGVGYFVCAPGKDWDDLTRASEEVRDSTMHHFGDGD